VNAAVIMHFCDLGDPHRRAAFDYVHGWYEHAGLEVVVDPNPQGRAAGGNAAIRRCNADVIVQSDPDSLVNLDNLRRACDRAAVNDGIVVPHSRYLYLNPFATRQVLSGVDPFTLGSEQCEFSGMKGVGNVVVFSRRTWDLAGGFDERFGMWGADDGAFAYAAWAYTGRDTRRVNGDMVHLWHPRQRASIPGTPGYAKQFALAAQYRDAAAVGPAAVRALVERRQAAMGR